MRRVLDASVALKWVLPEADSDKAIRLRDDFRNAALEFLAPDVFPAEVGHTLARAERRKIITPPLGSVFLADVLSTPPQLFPSYPGLITRAFAIASQRRAGVYDCLYVALAEREGCELITADDRLVKNLQPHFPFIVSLASLP
jgi:predicted nucleic acid-binding protein